MITMNKINIGLLAGVLLLACVVPPGFAQDAIGPLLENDLQLNTLEGVTGRVRVAFDGTRYLAVWSEIGDPADQSNTTPGIWGQFLTVDGVKDGEVFSIHATTGDSETSPDIAWNGRCYLVVWKDAMEIQGQVIDEYGIPVPYGQTEPLDISGCHFDVKENPAVASDGNNFLVVWQAVNGSRTVKAAVVSEVVPGYFLPSYRFGLDVNDDDDVCTNPTVSFGNDSYLVTWSYAPDMVNPSFDMRGVFVTGDWTGDPSESLDISIGTAFPIATGTGNQGGAIPAGSIFDGTNFIVTYGDDEGTTAKKVKTLTVSSDGVVGVPLEVADAPGLSGTDLALGSQEWFVVWGADGYTMGSRVQDGVVVDSGGVGLSAEGTSGGKPSVLFADENYLVFFEGYSSFDKYAQLVGITGEPTPVEAIDTAIDAIISLPPDAFRNEDDQNTLAAKLDAVIDKINAGDITGALNKLQNDILKKMDGNATIGSPDKNDWITESEAQDQIYNLILDIINLLQA